MILKAGDPFPKFELCDENGDIVSNQSLTGTRYIMYFYPKDDTPGCTIEACELRDSFGSLGDVQVFGVSPDGQKSHRKFIEKFKLPFRLLCDEEKNLAVACGIWVEKKLYGKVYMGVKRSTFLVAPDGVIEKVWDSVTPEGHAKEIVGWIAEAK